MPFAYFDRLSAARKVVYLRSDAIERVDLPPGTDLRTLLDDMEVALRSENRSLVERHAQALCNDLADRIRVPR